MKYYKILLLDLTFQIHIFSPFIYHHIFCYDPRCIITLSLNSLPAAPEENPPAGSLCQSIHLALAQLLHLPSAQAKAHFGWRTNGGRQIFSRAAAPFT